ncbi:MAG: hypothetical protein KJO43_02070, partial [Phycisphaerae bacterium]|nr:hypothetical protein [Phycisphaerae bacterium]
WEQRSADPATGEVVNAMHFRILRDGTAETQTELTLTDAFVYHWRLWGIAELRDAMAEAGFSQTAVHHAQPDAIDDAGGVYSRPLDGPDELDDSFVVLVVGRTE